MRFLTIKLIYLDSASSRKSGSRTEAFKVRAVNNMEILFNRLEPARISRIEIETAGDKYPSSGPERTDILKEFCKRLCTSVKHDKCCRVE